MKKKLLAMLTILGVSASVLIGCSLKTQDTAGSDSGQQTAVESVQEGELQTENTDQSKEDADEAVSEVTGTLDEIKDFMFIVTDDDKVSYAFSFEEAPEGLDEVQVGDKVIVKYTGTVSQIDPFKGEVLSIEKQF